VDEDEDEGWRRSSRTVNWTGTHEHWSGGIGGDDRAGHGKAVTIGLFYLFKGFDRVAKIEGVGPEGKSDRIRQYR